MCVMDQGHRHDKRDKKNNIQLYGLTHIMTFVSIHVGMYVHTFMRHVTYEMQSCIYLTIKKKSLQMTKHGFCGRGWLIGSTFHRTLKYLERKVN